MVERRSGAFQELTSRAGFANVSMNPDAQSQKKRVFIVDDHPLVREWLTALINQQPDLTVCGEAPTAIEAIRAITDSKPDVAIVDISLKDSCGIELIKALKETCPALTVLVLSMHEESRYAEHALRAGAGGYIMKRETTKKVIEAIRRVMEGKFYISDAIAQTITTQFVEGKTLATLSPVEQLSDRELAVFELIGQGLGTRQIAETLRVSMKTVQAYCARTKEKLNLRSATELLREAVRHSDTHMRGDVHHGNQLK
jgi:DNA-binding NarL/FixJ family response regulator